MSSGATGVCADVPLIPTSHWCTHAPLMHTHRPVCADPPACSLSGFLQDRQGVRHGVVRCVPHTFACAPLVPCALCVSGCGPLVGPLSHSPLLLRAMHWCMGTLHGHSRGRPLGPLFAARTLCMQSARGWLRLRPLWLLAWCAGCTRLGSWVGLVQCTFCRCLGGRGGRPAAACLSPNEQANEWCPLSPSALLLVQCSAPLALRTRRPRSPTAGSPGGVGFLAWAPSF